MDDLKNSLTHTESLELAAKAHILLTEHKIRQEFLQLQGIIYALLFPRGVEL